MRRDSVFEGSHLRVRKILQILYFWSRDLPLNYISHEVQINQCTLVNWLNNIREICGLDIMRHPLQIGGAGRIVAIDESKYFHRKYHRGRFREGQWVFGGIDVDDPTRCFLVPVDRRDRATLEPLIQRNIAPGSIIWSDDWRAYNGVSALGYTHHRVNHSANFVCPTTLVHTNHIENMWMRAKKKLRRMHGTQEAFFESYLEEWLWQQRHPTLRFQEIIRSITEEYALI